MKKNIFLLFISIFITLCSLEILLRIYYPQELTSPFRVYGKDGLRLNDKNNEAIHQFEKRKIKYKFGSLHNRHYEFKDKNNKILTLGDSFTFGWLIDDKDTFVYKLNSIFDDYLFINPSAGGWGTSDQLKYFLEFCEQIKPKYTILFINMFDFSRSKNSNLFYLDNNNNLIEGKNEYLKIKKLTENQIYKFLVENSHLINFIRKKITQIILSSKHYNKEVKKISNNNLFSKISIKNNTDYILEKKLFLKFKDEAFKCETKLILVNLAWENYNYFIDLKFLKENNNFFVDNQIIFLDLNNDMEIIRSNKDKYVIKNEGHPNELAHKLIYEIVYNKIRNLIR